MTTPLSQQVHPSSRNSRGQLPSTPLPHAPPSSSPSIGPSSLLPVSTSLSMSLSSSSSPSTSISTAHPGLDLSIDDYGSSDGLAVENHALRVILSQYMNESDITRALVSMEVARGGRGGGGGGRGQQGGGVLPENIPPPAPAPRSTNNTTTTNNNNNNSNNNIVMGGSITLASSLTLGPLGGGTRGTGRGGDETGYMYV